MIRYLLLCLVAGFASGYFGLFDFIVANGSVIVNTTLFIMMFVASIGIGKNYYEGKADRLDFRILVYSCAVVAGTLLAAILLSFILPLSMKDCLVVCSGMGWYSISTGIVFSYSPALSVAAFVCCLSREMSAMFLMSLLWKHCRTQELVSLAGSATLNTCVATATITGDTNIVLYGMISGTVVSMFVPFLVPFFTAL